MFNEIAEAAFQDEMEKIAGLSSEARNELARVAKEWRGLPLSSSLKRKSAQKIIAEVKRGSERHPEVSPEKLREWIQGKRPARID